MALYKENRRLIQKGDLYRLKSPFNGNETAWMLVSGDRKEAMVLVPNGPLRRLRLKGLHAEFDYRVSGLEDHYRGDCLMQIGLPIPLLDGDYKSVWFKLTAHHVGAMVRSRKIRHLRILESRAYEND